MARIGIDFGTTNSSVAYYDGRKLHSIELDPANENPHVLPSLIYIDRDFDTLLGTPAANEYLVRETGRRIVWERKQVRPIEIIVAGGGSAPIHYWHDIHIVTDTAANGRLLQSVKTALRDPGYEGTEIFDRYFTIDDLIAIILRSMKTSAEAQLGETCDSVVLGRPVRFHDDPAATLRAESLLYKAALFAGFRDITFQMEPMAAAHLYHITTEKREIALIYDFGGGTLDLTIAEVGGTRPPRVIATRGVLVGGDDLDRRMMRSLLPYFGKGARVDGGLDFPPDYLDLLHTWQTMPELSRPEPLSKIRRYQKTSTDPQAMLALETLVTQNIGFDLFRHIEGTKKALTGSLMARLDYEYGDVAIHERILRRAFEEMIEAELAHVGRETRQVVADAGMRLDQIDVVLRTGGTSLVPAFVEQLESFFGHDRIREMDPLTSVVGGMAVVAHEEGGKRPDYAYRFEDPFRYIKATSGRDYQHTILRPYTKAYTDRDYEIVRLPLVLNGMHAIKPADLDYDSEDDRLVRFKLERPSKVYVIYQAKANHLPKWLRGFTREDMLQVDIDTPGGCYPFFVYSRDFPAGAFSLGGAHAKGYGGIVFLNYIVAAKPH